MRRILARSTVLAAFALSAFAADARSQCDIFTSQSGATTTLCAISGTAWRWSGPGGFADTVNSCVDVTMPGTYTMFVFDGSWQGPCTVDVAPVPGAPVATITGPDSTCGSSPATLCGNQGTFDYLWNGPNSFSAATACIQAATAGAYSLMVRDQSTGDWSAPATLNMAAGVCEQPAPPPAASANCPRPAAFWNAAVHGERDLNPDQLVAIAAGVDAASQALSFGDQPLAGFAHVLQPAREEDSQARALRQFAAVMANLTAGPMGLTGAHGRPIGLDPNAVLGPGYGPDAGTTVGAWASHADAQLVSLHGVGGHLARQAFQRIRRTAYMLNVGVAIGAVCHPDSSSQPDVAQDAMDAVPDADAPFAVPAGVALQRIAPNPTAAGAQVAWSQDRAADVDLAVLDVAGRQVRLIVRGSFDVGTHVVAWDGRDDAGQPLRSGTYFVHGRIGGAPVQSTVVIVR